MPMPITLIMSTFLITPMLGAFRNYSKFKNINMLLFFRSPIICCILYSIYAKYCANVQLCISASCISERWVMLLYKTGVSVYNNDYETKKEKYRVKYGILY